MRFGSNGSRTRSGPARIGALVLLLACDGSVADPPPAPELVLSIAADTVVEHGTLQLSAMIRRGTATSPASGVSWSSSDTGVAKIAEDGVLRGVWPGYATVTASAEGVTGLRVMRVYAARVSSVTIAPDSILLDRTAPRTAVATPRDASGNALLGRTVIWSAADTNVAIVSGTGLVSARQVGATTLGARIDSVTGIARIIVRPPPIATLEVRPPNSDIVVGESFPFIALPRDALGELLNDRRIVWSSSDTTVLSVTDAGLARGRALGAATISAATEGVVGRASMRVIAVGTGMLVILPESASTSADLQDTVRFSAFVRQADGSLLPVVGTRWTIADTNIAYHLGEGLVRGLGREGQTTVTATAGALARSVVFRVRYPPTLAVRVSPVDLAIALNRSVVLTATVDIRRGFPRRWPVTWRSSDTSIVRITARDTSGLTASAEARAIGTAVITASYDTLSAAARMTVVQFGRIVSVSPDFDFVRMARDSAMFLTGRARDDVGVQVLNAPLTWSVADPAILSVDSSGRAVARAVGTTTVTPRFDSVIGNPITVEVLASTVACQVGGVGRAGGRPSVEQLLVTAAGKVHVVPVDGSATTRVFSPATHAAWSPNGCAIAIVSGGIVYITNADGTGVRRAVSSLTRGTIASVTWSPSATRFALMYHLAPQGGGYARANIDGTGVLVRELANNGGFGPPTWSQTDVIAFARFCFSFTTFCRPHIQATNADGLDLRILILEGQSPAWSPTSDRLAYTRTQYDSTASGGFIASVVAPREVRVARADGTGSAVVASLLPSEIVQGPFTAGELTGPTWSPDGSQVAFAASFNLSIYIVDLASQARRSVPTVLSSISAVAWRPWR